MNKSRVSIIDAQHLNLTLMTWRMGVKNRISSAYQTRFGQYVFNYHVSDGQPWPALFYETDTDKAYDMVLRDIYQTPEVMV